MRKTIAASRGAWIAVKVLLYAFAAAIVGFLLALVAGQDFESPLGIAGAIIVLLAIAVSIPATVVGFVLTVAAVWRNVPEIQRQERRIRQALLGKSKESND